MDPYVGGSGSGNTGRDQNPSQRGHSNVEESNTTTKFEDYLRRGNSDGAFLERGGSRIGEQLPEDGETWMDFLRHSGAQGDHREVQLAARRAALMATDRNRRLAAYAQDNTRPRSSSYIQHHHSRTRPNIDLPSTNLISVSSSQGNGNNLPRNKILDRPLPRRPSVALQYSRGGHEIVLPRWQSDSEVTKCPICNTAFSFWHRKHHCRKCGRVVCANCSPHRITIPRQFIVHPPEERTPSGQTRMNGIEVVDLTNDDESAPSLSPSSPENGRERGIDPSLGGGEEVRLCNPCVPDPNPLPHLDHTPPRYTLDSFPRPESIPQLPSNSLVPPRNSSLQRPVPPPPRMGSSSRQNNENRSLASFNSIDRRLSSGSGAIPDFVPDRQRIHRSHSSATSANLPNHLALSGTGPESSLYNRNLASILNEQRSSLHRHRPHASTGHIPTETRSSMSSSGEVNPISRQGPQPQLREEDECPICHSALPPKGPDGSETAREQHVTECIESHFSSSGPRTRNIHPSAATAAAVAASSATPRQAGATAGSAVSAGAISTEGLPSPSFSARRRTTGMVVYHASEKDCVGEDGEGGQECVICFDEFAVGDEMGRLECLCKFHKMCIRQWWDTKGPGSCPVHQGGL